jgi:hypothetical protein
VLQDTYKVQGSKCFVEAAGCWLEIQISRHVTETIESVSRADTPGCRSSPSPFSLASHSLSRTSPILGSSARVLSSPQVTHSPRNYSPIALQSRFPTTAAVRTVYRLAGLVSSARQNAALSRRLECQVCIFCQSSTGCRMGKCHAADCHERPASLCLRSHVSVLAPPVLHQSRKLNATCQIRV